MVSWVLVNRFRVRRELLTVTVLEVDRGEARGHLSPQNSTAPQQAQQSDDPASA